MKDMKSMKGCESIEGGVTAPGGFTASGVHAGIKKKGLDLALLVSERDATAAGVFTSNRVQGAHVPICRERLKQGRVRAVVVNSGNANACCGPAGKDAVLAMSERAGLGLSLPGSAVLVCSTGPIGVPLKVVDVLPGIDEAVSTLSVEGHSAAARAIMTTDTVHKEGARQVSVDGRTITIGGMSKGAGMIEPNMATMLAFLTTDAAVEETALQTCLKAAVDKSFNRISVDGDQSCNDTVLLLANGMAGNRTLTETHPDWPAFSAAVESLALELALKMVEDGEGVTRVVTLRVEGAMTDADARLVARAVGNSLLVKTSWYGGEPNWGRVIDAAGYSGAALDQEKVCISYDGLPAVVNGQRNADVAESALAAVIGKPRFELLIQLQMGTGSDYLYGCDCSVDYVKINSEYLS